jgi:hypothetical protein
MNWRRLASTGAALPVFYADNSGVIYDSKRDRLIIAQGDANAMAHLWSFDFTTGAVTRLHPADSVYTTANDGHYRDLVYVPFQDMVIFGIRQSQGHLAYDCAANVWKYYPITLDASVSSGTTLDDRGAGYMFDAKRNLVWVSDYNCAIFVMRPDTHSTNVTLARLGPTKSQPLTIRQGTQGRITIEGTLEALSSIAVYDIRGRNVLPLFTAKKNRTMWQSNALPCGYYTVAAKTNNGFICKGIVLK